MKSIHLHKPLGSRGPGDTIRIIPFKEQEREDVPVFHPGQCSRVRRILIQFEKAALRFLYNGVIDWFEMLKELLHIGGVDIDFDMETEAGGHVDDGCGVDCGDWNSKKERA